MRPSSPGPSAANASTRRATRRARCDRHADPLAEAVDLVGIDVDLGVAEAVDPQHLADDRVALLAGERHDPGPQQVGIDRCAELGEIDAVRQVGGRGCEHVAAGERRARGRELVRGVGQRDRRVRRRRPTRRRVPASRCQGRATPPRLRRPRWRPRPDQSPRPGRRWRSRARSRHRGCTAPARAPLRARRTAEDHGPGRW